MGNTIEGKFHLHFFNSLGEFSEKEKTLLTDLCKKFLPKIDAVLTMPPVDIVFAAIIFLKQPLLKQK